MDQGSIDALYQSFRDAAEQGSIDAWYQSFKAAEQRRTDFLCQSLRDAAEQGSIDALYALIRTNADVLDSMDKIPIVETPLHIAAFLGHTEFAMEIMKLKPSFARKLNQDGFSPMHLALQKLQELEKSPDSPKNQTQLLENNPDLQRNQTQLPEKNHDLQRNQTQLVDHDSENDHALQRKLTILVYRLLDVDKDLIRVQGREGVTPLHYVAQKGNLKFLKKFSKVCPESFEDVTIRRETALHIALRSDKVEAFEILLKRLQKAWFKDAKLLEKKVLYWEDWEGDTLLHVAVLKNLPKVVSSLMDTGLVDIKAKNLKGDTVFDILERQTQEDNKLRIREMLERQKRLDKSQTARLLDYFRFPISTNLKKCRVGIRRQQTGLTDEKRNALLVVAALLITVIYPLPFSADEKPNQFNYTAPINGTYGANHNYHFNDTARSTITISDIKHLFQDQSHMRSLYSFNAIIYYLTNVTLCFLLPPGLIGSVLYCLLAFLFFTYLLSIMFLLSAPFFYVFVGELLFVPLVFLPRLTAFIDRPVKDFSSFNIE